MKQIDVYGMSQKEILEEIENLYDFLNDENISSFDIEWFRSWFKKQTIQTLEDLRRLKKRYKELDNEAD